MVNKSKKLVKITTEFITLGQFLKLTNVITNGGEAKSFIMEHDIKVNGEDNKQRGKKLRNGDSVIIDNTMFFEILG